MQWWNGCSSLAQGEVTALYDMRDSNTYAVAKLADGQCWMIENLRLDNTNSDNAYGDVAQGYASSFVGLANPESPWDGYSTLTANSLYSTDGSNNTMAITGNYQVYRFPRYNNNNTSSTIANMTTPTNTSIYSYGNYYSWSAVVADTGNYNTNSQSITNTSICPDGWRLPQGGNKTRIESYDDNDFWNLVVDGLNNSTNPANYNSQAHPYYNGTTEAGPISNTLRAFPNNFLYSGYIYDSSVGGRGNSGSYWSSTVSSNIGSYDLDLDGSNVYPGTYSTTKSLGYTVRCIAEN
jgi:uncharacterized protein (TIGR02145 family)